MITLSIVLRFARKPTSLLDIFYIIWGAVYITHVDCMSVCMYEGHLRILFIDEKTLKKQKLTAFQFFLSFVFQIISSSLSVCLNFCILLILCVYCSFYLSLLVSITFFTLSAILWTVFS